MTGTSDRARSSALRDALSVARLGRRRVQRRRRQRVPRVCRAPTRSAIAPWPSPPTAPAIPSIIASWRSQIARAVRPAARDHPHRELERPEYRANPQPLLLLQARALHAPDAPRRRPRRRRRRRQQRRRPRRLPAGPPGGARVRRAQPARRSRISPRTRSASCRARAGLPTWDEPASACLSSRIPYHHEVTDEKLRQIERAEEALRALGFRVCRVRHHDDLARIEFGRDELPRALEPEMRAAIVRELKAVGYRYVTIDLQGYRTGSLNEGLCCCRPRVTRAGPAWSPRARIACAAALFLAAALCRFCPPRSKISTRSTSRSACATSTSRSISRIRPAIRSSSPRPRRCTRPCRSEVHALALLERRSPARLRVARRWSRSFARLDTTAARRRWALVAARVAVDVPAVLVHGGAAAERLPGLAAAIGVQALIAVRVERRPRARRRPAVWRRSPPGIRSQVVWLTVPLLVLASTGSSAAGVRARRGAAGAAVASASAGSLWAIPLVVVTGGPTAYWRALLAVRAAKT